MGSVCGSVGREVASKNLEKKRTLFFSERKMGTRSSKFVFYDLPNERMCSLAVWQKKWQLQQARLFYKMPLNL